MFLCLCQASGEAVYSSDVGVGDNQLYARVVASTEVLANLDTIDPSEALQVFKCSSGQTAWSASGLVAFSCQLLLPGRTSDLAEACETARRAQDCKKYSR